MSQSRFRVSLRAGIIALGCLGAGIGILGRLYLYEPEVFQWALHGTILLGFIIQIGATAYWIRHRKSSKLLLVVPYLTTILLFVLLKSTGILSSDALSALPTWYLIEKKLFTVRDGQLLEQVGVWDELDRRLMENRLSDADAEAICLAFENALRQQEQRPQWRSFYTRSLRTMTSREMITTERLVSLGEAYYGKPPVIPLRIRQSESPVVISIDYGHIGVDRPHPTKLIWKTRRVRLDDVAIEFEKGIGSLAARVDQELLIGRHEVRVDLDCALVRYDELTGHFGGAIPETQWPAKVMKEWSEEVMVSLTVYPADEQIVSLTTDVTLDPASALRLSVETMSGLRPTTSWLLNVELLGELPVAVSGDLVVIIDGQKFDAGVLALFPNDGSLPPRQAYLQDWQLDPKNVRSGKATIEFVPNPKYLERETTITEIWGETMVFENVKIDLGK